MLAYDFPVKEEDQLRPDGSLIPNKKSIVRVDTGEWLSSVSRGYKIITHNEVMGAAHQYISRLGAPESRYFLNKNGCELVGEFTFTDKTIALEKGDLVGLRVYVTNSYNGTRSVGFKVGAMVLACKNGMMLPGEKTVGFRHRHNTEFELNFPDPELVMMSFGNYKQKWDALAKIELDVNEYMSLLEQAIGENVVSRDVHKAEMTEPTAWGLYNQMTYLASHRDGSDMAKFRQTSRISSWIMDRFAV